MTYQQVADLTTALSPPPPRRTRRLDRLPSTVARGGRCRCRRQRAPKIDRSQASKHLRRKTHKGTTRKETAKKNESTLGAPRLTTGKEDSELKKLIERLNKTSAVKVTASYRIASQRRPSP